MTWQELLLAIAPGPIIIALIQAGKEAYTRKRTEPLTKAQAQTAIKADVVGMSNSLASQALAISKNLQEQLAHVQARVDRLEASREIAIGHIAVLEHHILAAKPPPPPARPPNL